MITDSTWDRHPLRCLGCFVKREIIKPAFGEFPEMAINLFRARRSEAVELQAGGLFRVVHLRRITGVFHLDVQVRVRAIGNHLVCGTANQSLNLWAGTM